jgi:uncharacterized membrane protein AbrB (regulator of aidB expression)
MKIKYPLACLFGSSLMFVILVLFLINSIKLPIDKQHLNELFGFGFLAGMFMLGFSVEVKE